MCCSRAPVKYWHCPPLSKKSLLHQQCHTLRDGDTSHGSKCAGAGTRRLLAAVSLIYCVSYIFLMGFLSAKTTAGTCLWQQILGNGSVAVVPLPALPVPEPWKARAVAVWQGGVSCAGQRCREGEAGYSSSSNHHPTPSVGARTTSPSPARMPSSTPCAPLPFLTPHPQVWPSLMLLMQEAL